jgi:glycosyltransferase involved in cell wall biosynthesis
MFSVVIPLYQKAETIGRAIHFVLQQPLQDFEIVVVNDSSTDRGPEVVATMQDHRIRLFRQNNSGVSVARDRGTREAQGNSIACFCS